MKKRKIILIAVIVIFVLMLIPIPTRWKNGITEYKAILYKYTKVHTPSDISFTGYEDGWELKILGIRVGGNINADERLKHNEDSKNKFLIDMESVIRKKDFNYYRHAIGIIEDINYVHTCKNTIYLILIKFNKFSTFFDRFR